MAEDEYNDVRAAQAKLIDALQELKAATVSNPDTPVHTVVTDWLVVTRNRGFDEDGDPCGYFSWITPLGQEPHVNQMLAQVLEDVDFIPLGHFMDMDDED